MRVQGLGFGVVQGLGLIRFRTPRPARGPGIKPEPFIPILRQLFKTEVPMRPEHRS